MTTWEIVTSKIPFSEFSEYLDRREENLSDEQLNDEELLKSLSSNGYEIIGSKAVKESYKVSHSCLLLEFLIWIGTTD